ncbi:hypothetical protein HYH02_015280 [Chlamydomonas schloesseri]|uniref:Uncharacterized protein n=1 Tax=Chlamydomonas schloesseri TaxID=2026947 RepID=A0A835VS19_9CHLO|nr:hypothetical protein HYH02_015280 [Chlamydomonas schloesseri]|eukprot:KAG2423748.1 hypothetical protein HYH02_015280 [Chlamydomonas schloesseri]
MSETSLLEPAGGTVRVVQQNLLHDKVDARLLKLATDAMTKFNEVIPSRSALITSIADVALRATGQEPTPDTINSMRGQIYEARAGGTNWTLPGGEKVAALGMAITLPAAQGCTLAANLWQTERWVLELSHDHTITPAKRRPTVTIQAGANRSAPESEGKVAFLASAVGRHDLEKVMPFTAIVCVQSAACEVDAAAVTAAAEVAMYEDLDDLLFPAPSPKRARGGGP